MLEAKVLMCQGAHEEVIKFCAAFLDADATQADAVGAHLARARCWVALGESERAFVDCRAALTFAPGDPGVHEASAEVLMDRGSFAEAIAGWQCAAKVSGSVTPRVSYQLALAHLATANLVAALKELGRTLRLLPVAKPALRARDGVAALQLALRGDFAQAHVRFNVLLHARVDAGSARGESGGFVGSLSGFALLMQPYELLLYRGVCAMYQADRDDAVYAP